MTYDCFTCGNSYTVESLEAYEDSTFFCSDICKHEFNAYAEEELKKQQDIREQKKATESGIKTKNIAGFNFKVNP